MTPIADQCAALGWTINELLGRTAGECRATSTHGRLTGLAWVRPDVCAWVVGGRR